MIKAIYEKHPVNIILVKDWYDSASSDLVQGQGKNAHLPLLLFITVLEVLTRAVWQGKERKDIQMGKERVDADDVILYM